MELRSTLEDSLEDSVDGEPSEDDVEALLMEFGSPEKIAASYQPSGQYLVGPEMFPFFKIVIGAVLLAVSIGLAVAFFMGAVFAGPADSETGRRIAVYLGNYLQALLAATGSVVIVFFVLQRYGIQPDVEDESEWEPSQLPEVDDFDLVGRGESIAGIAFSAVILILLNVFADKIGIVVSWGDEPILNHIVQDNLLLLNVAIILGLSLNVYLLWQGRWNIYTRVAKLFVDLFWLIIIIRMVNGLSDGKEILVEAGLVDPLPTMFVLFGYFVVVGIAVSIVVNVVKVILNLVQNPTEGFQIKFGSD
jgi:hypothetical protein